MEKGGKCFRQLLQEVISRLGDITRNRPNLIAACQLASLRTNIRYARRHPYLRLRWVSSLQDVGVVELALQLYIALDNGVLDDSQPAGYIYLALYSK